MRSLIFAFIILCTSCGKDKISYPKSYTFSHVDQTEEGLFLVIENNNATELDRNSGTYGQAREDILEESAESIRPIFDLQTIELLSENMVRIHIIIDEEEIDTVVDYTQEGNNIIIDALSSSDVIYYDQDEDQFVVCGFTTIALPGPNANQGSQYYQINVEDCLEEGDLQDHLVYSLDQYDLEILDTVAIFITKIIYK